ncbi:hypothetical protein RJT34_27516 [Clitoria ternatea]|uniref:B-block binding subunit of TFIIIC domain-containing protein n=1 Tax=Clitoria ternatea TaxID=43366 RepID=A0AAN9IC40_CLITE
MDAVINAAVEEICSGVEDGLTLAALWAKLKASPSLSSSDLHLSPAVKTAIWTNLLRIPTLRFEPESSPPQLKDAENLNVKIFARQPLADNFLGLYDSQSLQHAQTRVLHLLANARANGITQNQLAKHLRVDGNNFHYVLRSLECQGLIVKHSAIEKKKQVSTHGESKSYPPVTTNVVYLHRYAKQHAPHERLELEITKFNTPEDDYDGATFQTDVHLKEDYALQMKAICDKLAKANGKVLLVSDLRKELGYSGKRQRLKAWRLICHKLIADGILEQFDAKVNGKIEACLRLVDPITTGSANEDKMLNSGKTCQVIDQLVELPIEHQIVDIIDAAGSCGITVKEICERLGVGQKKSHIRIVNLCYRFGMKVREEQCLKSKTIRVWTSKNFNPLPEEVELIHKLDENESLNQYVPYSSKTISEFESSTINGELADLEKLEDNGIGREPSSVSPRNIESDLVQTPTDMQDFALDQRGTVSRCKFVSSSMETDNASSGAFPSDSLKQLSTGSYQRYPSSFYTVDGVRRANRILERLKAERFILKPDLNRWLNTFESTKLDRKTIDRILTKLQEQGQVKCITVHSPLISEYSRTKDCVVVVHPSISLSPEFYDEVQDRVRSFNNYIRSKNTSDLKNDESIPVMEDIQTNQSLLVPDGRGDRTEVLRANGFVLAKMTRAKLLHSFLWDCLHRSPSLNDGLSSKKCFYEQTDNPHSSSKLFSLETAIKEIPVELFLQVVGSNKKYEEMLEKCKMGSRLSDLPMEEYKCLMDAHATGRLSFVIDLLRRLKLIRMVTDSQSRDGVKTSPTFTHMMELKPYIEEPFSNEAASLNFIFVDLRPRIRHDFILSDRDAVNEYWQTLEYCYATADRNAASYAFPGSVVPELFRYRSWATSHLMTAEQRAKLLKRVKKDDFSEKISFRDCEKIAKDLNLTLEQVLSMYSSRHRRCLNQSKDEENSSLECKGSTSRRRKNNSTELKPAKHARIDAATDVLSMNKEEPHNLDLHSGQHATHVEEFEEDDYEVEGSQGCIPLISQCVLTKMKPARERRFIWSDKTDRQLVIQYAKHRAVLGARHHRMDWTSISDLPAPPRTCRRRMSFLNGNLRFRKAVNTLCTILSERYAKQLEKLQNFSLNKDNCKQFVRSKSCEGVHNNYVSDVENPITSLNIEAWDDLENKSIKKALDEVLRCKMMAKLEASSQKVQLQSEGWLDANANTDGYILTLKPVTNCKQVGGNGGERFELSQQFLHGVSKSPFPFNTGKQAVRFSEWLQEKDQDLTEGGSNLADDLQCGGIFHLFALVSSGELSISPCLPDNGVGEAEDLRSSTAKRKSDAIDSNKAKKLKSLFGVEGEIISRREKGFPGIIVYARRVSISRADILNMFKDNDSNAQSFEGNFQLNKGQSSNYSLPDHMLEIINSCDPIPVEENHIESPWEAMTLYAQRLISESSNQEHAIDICAEVFKAVYASIQKAGDQGLSMGEISQLINLPGAEVDGLIIDALQAFGKVLKVNAYDTVRVVDSLYSHKYFLTPVSEFCKRVGQPFSTKTNGKRDHTCELYKSKQSDTTSVDTPRERNSGIDSVHKVTILNLPHGDVDSANQACNRNKGFKQDKHGLSRSDHEKETLKFASDVYVPILPWMNGDGTINSIVYRGIKRRVLGIVMQNPGILEDDILRQMHVLNPQSCRTLLELMVLDKHLIVRKMHQNISDEGPSLLQNLIRTKSSQPKLICRDHFYANPMSTLLL